MRAGLGMVVGVLVAVVVSGCGSQEASPQGTASGSSSGGASTSASATASPSPSESPESKERAASATKKAMLPSSAFKKVGLSVKDEPKESKWDWFDTCEPFLPSESRQVTGYGGQWRGEGLIVNQTVVAYPDGVAEDLVGEVATAVSCTKYSAGKSSFTKVETLKLPAVADADATHAWCMRQDDEFYVCHSVLAAQDLVGSLWVAAKDKDDAVDALGTLTQLAAARIEAQIGG